MGTMEAINIADLELRLGRMGLDFIRAREVRQQVRWTVGGRIQRRDIISFCLHLEQLTGAGVPLLEGLSDLRDTTEQPRFREVLTSMIESIEGGSTLSGAMAGFPQVFDRVVVSLVRVGEETGRLSEVFANLTSTLKWQDEQIAQTKKVLSYPILVGVVLTGVVFFLMTYLVPQLTAVIHIMGGELPLHTSLLLQISGVFVEYWYLILGLPVAALLLVKHAARRSPSVRYVIDDYKLKVWGIGPLLKKTALARFANYFALLYSSGITVLECLRMSEEIVANRAIALAMIRAGRKIADGSGIGDSFEYAGLFPPLVLRMLRVGENSGALEVALMNISYFYSRDVKESVERLQTLIGPIMTIVLAVVLGWVMFSVLGPIYDLITTLSF